jgi:predicted RNA-binding Zn ribbon-like protein
MTRQHDDTVTRPAWSEAPGRTDGPDGAAGHPFLAFVNTVEDGGKTRRTDAFETGEELRALMAAAGIGDPGHAPGPGRMPDLLILREASYGVLSSVAARRRPGHEDTLVVETAIKNAMQDARLDLSGGVPLWHPGPLGGLHDRLALSLADLLSAPDIGRLRECRRCTRLFLDHGRGTGRRWCSMSRCGNRAKAEGFRRRRAAS